MSESSQPVLPESARPVLQRRRSVSSVDRCDSEFTVVCFGDSNTWGASGKGDEQGQRLPHKARWTTQLDVALGGLAHVIPEGLCGRTTIIDDPHNFVGVGGGSGEASCGRRYLTPMLHSHKPVDLVVLGLGCNDMKVRFGLLPSEVAKGAKCLIDDIRRSRAGPGGAPPKIVLLSPPQVRMAEELDFHPYFGPQREATSREVIAEYAALALAEGLEGFISLADVRTSDDGLHFDAEGSGLIAAAVSKAVAAALEIDLEPKAPEASAEASAEAMGRDVAAAEAGAEAGAAGAADEVVVLEAAE